MGYEDVQENCSYCSGTGKVRCSSCNGSGVDYSRNGESCSACYASGYETCSNCYGSGKVTTSVYRNDSDSSNTSSLNSSSSSSSAPSYVPNADAVTRDLIDRAYFMSNRGEYDKAIATCTQGINIASPFVKSWGGWSIGTMSKLHLNRGYAYFQRAVRDQSINDKEQAISDWKQALDYDIYNSTARKNLEGQGINYRPIPVSSAPAPVPQKKGNTVFGIVYGITSIIGLFFAATWAVTLYTGSNIARFSTAIILLAASCAVSLVVWMIGKKSLIFVVMMLAIFGWLFLTGVIPENVAS